jgi:hypothetical protein
MTQTLRMRIPPANTDRPWNGAIQKPPAGLPALCLRPRRRGPWNEKPSQDLAIDFQIQNPAHARAGFLLFLGMPSSADQFGKLLDRTCFNRQRTTLTRNRNGVT